MVAVTLLSKLVGMFRDILLASNYGTSESAVAYETASRLPIILFDLVIGGVVTASFIPIYNELIVKKGKPDALKFANQYVNLVFIITAAVSIIGILFSDLLVGLLAPDIAEGTKALASVLTRIMFPMIIFTGFAFSFTGILQSHGEYNIPALISLVSNSVLVIYFYTINNRFGIFGLSVAMLVGWFLQAAVQLPKLHSLGFIWKPSFKIASPYIKRAVAMGALILVGTWTQPLCTLINTRFASGLEGGRAITALGYANKLYIVIVGLFSFVATNLLFPYLSKAVSGGDIKQARRIGSSSVKLLWLTILPLSAGVLVITEPIIKIIYMRGEFTENDASLTAQALRFLAIGMPAMAANEVFTKMFYSKQKTKLPMISAVVSMVFNFIFLYLLTSPMGIGGIAISSGLAVIINALLNYILLYKSGDRLFSAGDLLDLLKMAFCALVMGAAVAFIYQSASGMGEITASVISVISGALIYACLCLLLPISEVKAIRNKIYNKFKGKGSVQK